MRDSGVTSTMLACVRACLLSCLLACVRTYVRTCVRACVVLRACGVSFSRRDATLVLGLFYFLFFFFY